MNIPRTWWVWTALAVCAATLLAAMTWQTRNAISAEQDRISAEARADLQERMRLSLWRMDSAGAAILAEETNTDPAAPVRARFHWLESGQVASPQPGGILPELKQNLQNQDLSCSQVLQKLESGAGGSWNRPLEPVTIEPAQPQRQSAEAQKSANTKELQKRNLVIDNIYQQQMVLPSKEGIATLPAIAIPGPFHPIWIGKELFLMKPLASPARGIAGSWMDLPKLQQRLLAETRDLLPAARLVPAKGPSDDGLVLASFPLRLEPGPLPAYQGSFTAPIKLSLVAGWGAAILAILAASLLVFGIMRLSERRASFVSAVTHELRTPLTTFRLYSDMLESGAVKPEKRGDYLRVLSREADRLSHLVENVLAFSRIERGSARSAVSTTRVSDLLEPMRERFESRLATAGLTLVMPLDDPAANERVRVDAAAVEHILFNLVDNTAKYAANGEPPVLAISVGQQPGFVAIRVSDHGPGIPPSEHRRIFRAFHKSARDAAETRPGVGLGLALSRRLARSLGGDLVCTPAEGKSGALFILTLPVSRVD